MVITKTFAFVFARGGTKGLPGKNLLPIAGHPMLAHSIRIAQQIAEVASIFVSTDCSNIAETGAAYGAEIILRPEHLASDTAPEWLAWQHAIKYVKSRYGVFDCFLSLPPTAPCSSIADVRRCIDALTFGADLVLTTTPSHRSPWFNMVLKRDDGCLELIHKCDNVNRRQDAPSCFDIATVAYAARPEFVMRATNIWDGKIRGVEIPPGRAVDIDTYLDYAIARFLKEHYLSELVDGENA